MLHLIARAACEQCRHIWNRKPTISGWATWKKKLNEVGILQEDVNLEWNKNREFC